MNEEVVFTVWNCPHGPMGHFTCEMATTKDISEHLSHCEYLPSFERKRKTYGFDYWKTLSHHHDVLVPLIDALVTCGNRVVVISACGKDKEKTTPDVIATLNLPLSVEIHMVIWDGDKQETAPEIKHKKAKELGVDVFFDDREDICTYFNERGLPCFRSPFYKYFEKEAHEEKNV
jgi:hypothetical protein